MHRLGALGSAGAMRPAQVAHDVAVVEEVDALAHQRSASAVAAVGPSGGQSDHAVSQQLALEIGLGDAEKRPQHGRCFAAGRPPPALRRSSRDR